MKTILVDAMGTFVIEDKGIYEPMYTLLETYPNRKIILTMAPDDLMEKWGLNNMPYEVFTSRLDLKKTDPNYYHQMLKHFDLKTEEVIYFEHNKEAVKTAQSIGILSYHYDDEKRDMEQLKKFLDENL